MVGLFNVVLRGTVYRFRRGVPDDSRQHLNRRELARSLGTGDIRAAKLVACRLHVAPEGLFPALRGAPMLTDDQIAHLVQDFYTQWDRPAFVDGSGGLAEQGLDRRF